MKCFATLLKHLFRQRSRPQGARLQTAARSLREEVLSWAQRETESAFGNEAGVRSSWRLLLEAFTEGHSVHLCGLECEKSFCHSIAQFVPDEVSRPQEEKYEIDTPSCTNEMISPHLNRQSFAFAEEAPLRGSKQRSVTSLPLGNDALERGMNVTSEWIIQKNAPP
ncbi:hypothetical protein CEXT_361571 [Caerostris extrusa]|uniref:Uncharacterized protein n=1 Tax=Caerostris extrusa TaxID=172846 RepID=A0AAV4WFC1_CAEEX|nr:hypothetical protein CEXT_361571 [Caerostris extrusa]